MQHNNANALQAKGRRKQRRGRGEGRWWALAPKAPLPDKLVVRLRYSALTTINPGAAGTVGAHVFSANGLYDPDVTSTGHQPRGFDQLMTMYAHYTVVASRIKVDFCSRNANVYDQVCAIALKDSSSAYTDIYDYTEGRNVTMGVVDAGASSSHLTLRRSFDASQFFGIPHDLTGMGVYRGDTSQNPSEQAYFHVVCAPIQAQDAANLDISCHIEYVAVLTEPVNPSES